MSACISPMPTHNIATRQMQDFAVERWNASAARTTCACLPPPARGRGRRGSACHDFVTVNRLLTLRGFFVATKRARSGSCGSDCGDARSTGASSADSIASDDSSWPEAGLVIEIDGGQHARDGVEDELRTNGLERTGLRVLRFWNHDVLGNTDGVVRAIADVLDRTATEPSPCPSLAGRGE
jgi:hypothetical protein